MKLTVLICSCALLAPVASAQRFSLGVQGGIPAQTPLGQTNDKMPFVLGPTVDIGLFSGLSLSTGVLFSRAGERFDNGAAVLPENAVTLFFGSAKSHATEVPVLGKYRFLSESRSWRPFVLAGVSVRRTSIETITASSVLGEPPRWFNPAPPTDNKTIKWNADPTVGAGVDFQTGRFHLEPEVRYSYWGAGKHTPLRQNQVQFLLGFRF